MKDKREELLQESMKKLFVKMAVPGMIGMLVIGLYNLVDSIFVGQFVGPAAVSAVAMGYAVVLVNQAILSLFATGAMSIFSRAMGEQDQETMDSLFGNIFWMVGFLSILLTIITRLFTTEILSLLGAEGEILELGIKYVRVLSLGFVFGALGPALNFLIRAEGQMKRAMMIVGLGTIVNIVLDPIFIKLPGMGIRGAAVATIIGQFIVVIANFIHFGSKSCAMNFNARSFLVRWKLVPEMLKIGISGMIMSVAVSLQLSILLSLSARYGEYTVIVMSTAFRVTTFFFIPLFGISYGLQPVLGANYGAKLYGRVREAFWYFVRIASVLAVCIWLFFQLFPSFILSWFITDPAIVEAGESWFRMFQSSFILYGFIVVFLMLFMALGRAAKSALMTLGRQILFFIPLAFLLSRLFGETGLWFAYPAGDLCVTVLGIFLVAGELSSLKKKEAEWPEGSKA